MDYLTFVEEFTRILVETSGIERERVQFEQEGGENSLPGDRLLIEFADYGEHKEICALHIRELYELHQKGHSTRKLVQEVIGDVEKAKGSLLHQRIKELSDYGKTRGNLFVRLLNRKKHKKNLEGTIYKSIGDIVLVVYVKMEENRAGLCSVKLPDRYLTVWKKNREEIFKEALLNTYFISPPRIYKWEKLVFDPEYSGENFMDLTREHGIVKGPVGNCLSTSKKVNGAVAVFLPGVAERLYTLLGGDFYVVFTSIHEAMIHHVETAQLDALQEVLDHILEEVTPEEELLSQCIYYYSHETMSFRCVSGREE